MDGDLVGGCTPYLYLNRQETEDGGVPIRQKFRSFNDMIQAMKQTEMFADGFTFMNCIQHDVSG